MAQTENSKAIIRDIFIDESSQTNHRYLLLGGIICRCTEAELDKTLIEARGSELPFGELGWVKVSRSKLGAYRRFVDVFLEGEFSGKLDFHSLIVDTHKIDDATYNKGSRNAGFNKEIYQLLMKFDRLYPRANFHVYLDRRDTHDSLDELQQIVNYGIKKRSPTRYWPVRRLHFRNSADCQTLQLVDVLLGAIGFHINGHRMKPNASPAKCELADYILACNRILDPHLDTSMAGKFTIWHRVLREPMRKR